MNWVLIVGLLLHLLALPIILRRGLFLFRLARHGQPAPDRIRNAGAGLKSVVTEVFGQKRLLKWTIPGLAHFFTFWAFVILGTVYVEAYGVLLGPDDFAIPVIGDWWILGFAQDTIALMVLLSIVAFLVIRLRNSPAKLGRRSRFKGSHEFGAYLVLFFIFLVVATMFLFRGAAKALGNFENSGAYVSNAVGSLLSGLGDTALHVLEGVGLLAHLAVMLVFLIEVLHSKHLHVIVAPLNVLFKRQPIALGAAKPLMNDGKPVTLDDIDELDEDATLGVGSIEDFSWKGILDMQSCTECGRCQSQCPAWNTEKPLSPKLMIMALRDHAYGAGDYLLKDPAARESYSGPARDEAERPLVGETEGEPWAPTGGGVIDPDVLWSCVTCGACVQQCPVDIEHVDHIIDMRRHQVLVEANFPAELNQLFKGMENKGNPWNMSPNARMDWAKGLDFEVPVVGEDLESLESVDWLFWVGCAGAYEDRAMKTTRAVAELLDIAGVSFGVLGKGETCTGDSARRAGNEFVFQGLAQQNVETFKEFKVKKVVSTCAHCFNTLKNEYKEFGIELEVVHHTQLLNRLVREGRLTPVAQGEGAAKRSITYHDPCYIGRHNQVYEPPRELLQVLPGAEVVEMERNSERSFCCGAGGARMWMEETIGERINVNRTTEAVGTGADQIAVGCPFCRVMLSDGLTALKDSGDAREEVEVLDVAQMLLASVKGVPATKAKAGAAAGGSGSGGTATALKAEPEPGDATDTPQSVSRTEEVGAGAGAAAGAGVGGAAAAGGGSLFDLGDDSEADQPATEEAASAEPSTGGSLFDLGGDSEAEADTAPSAEPSTGGSLFDIAGDEPATEERTAEPAEPAAAASEPAATSTDRSAEPSAGATEPSAGPDLGTGGSLFDLEAPAEPEPAAPAPTQVPDEEPAAEEPKTSADAVPAADAAAPAESGPSGPEPSAEIPEGGSLFDIAAPEAPPTTDNAEASTAPAPEAPEPAPADDAGEVGDAGEAGSTKSGTPSGAVDPQALSASATAAASDESTESPEKPAEPLESAPDAVQDEAGDSEEPAEQEPAEQEEARPQPPAASGPAHQPRTDADIEGTGSLFDL